MTQHYYPLHCADELQSHFSKLPTLATNCAIVLKEAKTKTVQTYRRHLVPSSSETFSHFTPPLFLLLLFLKGAHVLVLGEEEMNTVSLSVSLTMVSKLDVWILKLNEQSVPEF